MFYHYDSNLERGNFILFGTNFVSIFVSKFEFSYNYDYKLLIGGIKQNFWLK